MEINTKKWIPNRQKAENHIAIILTIAISGYILFGILSVFALILSASSDKFLETIIASFAGAFFAFLFLRVGEILEKYYQRQVKHFNALVSMEIFYDEVGSIIYDNIYLMPQFRSTIISGNVYGSIVRPIPIRRDYYEELHDIKLINDLYKLNYDARRINDDLESTNDWYLQLKQLYTTGQMTTDHYIVNAKILAEGLKVIQASSTLLLDDVVRLNAIAKMRLESDKPLLTRLMHFIINKTREDITEEQIKQKMELLKDEILESETDSRPRIEKIKKMVEEME